eukprot:scaffold1489_cov194-Cylindrotheca_fusiformis.AAC.18
MHVIASATVIMARCARSPDTESLLMMRLLETFRALCAVHDTKAARRPMGSNVGEFHDAAAMPSAIGTSDSSTRGRGSALGPSNINVIIKLAMNKKAAGSERAGTNFAVSWIRFATCRFGWASKPRVNDPRKREKVSWVGLGNIEVVNKAEETTHDAPTALTFSNTERTALCGASFITEAIVIIALVNLACEYGER